jgi:hypothetical protein
MGRMALKCCALRLVGRPQAWLDVSEARSKLHRKSAVDARRSGSPGCRLGYVTPQRSVSLVNGAKIAESAIQRRVGQNRTACGGLG